MNRKGLLFFFKLLEAFFVYFPDCQTSWPCFTEYLYSYTVIKYSYSYKVMYVIWHFWDNKYYWQHPSVFIVIFQYSQSFFKNIFLIFHFELKFFIFIHYRKGWVILPYRWRFKIYTQNWLNCYLDTSAQSTSLFISEISKTDRAKFKNIRSLGGRQFC